MSEASALKAGLVGCVAANPSAIAHRAMREDEVMSCGACAGAPEQALPCKSGSPPQGYADPESPPGGTVDHIHRANPRSPRIRTRSCGSSAALGCTKECEPQ